MVQRVLSLVEEMEELLSAESKRLGAWGMLGDGTGARLLCPDTGTVLTKEHIIGEPSTKATAKSNAYAGTNNGTYLHYYIALHLLSRLFRPIHPNSALDDFTL